MILEAIPSIINAVSERVIEKLRRQLALSRKGNEPMNTTNRLSNSLKAIGEPGLLCDIEIEGEDYGAVLDKGISNIPFSWTYTGSGAGNSEYIKGLARWAAIKFYGGNYKKGLQAAFRIAKTQKVDASAPSKPGWVKEIKNDLNKEVGQDLHNTVFATIELDINTSILNRTI